MEETEQEVWRGSLEIEQAGILWLTRHAEIGNEYALTCISITFTRGYYDMRFV
jgi:hypothetical protein